ATPWNQAVTNLLAGDRLSGQSGASGNTLQMRIVGTGGTPLPGVSMQLVSVKNGCDLTGCVLQDPSSGPVVSCATGSGASANIVLTDSNGIASCTPVFGGV